MGIVRKSIPPPALKEGEIVQATIRDIKSNVKSKYPDDTGNPQFQTEVYIELANGYQSPVWMKYYEIPTDKSIQGQLIETLQKLTGKEYESNEAAFADLKKYGRIFLKVSGFRESNEQLYPKFQVVGSRLPALQREMPVTTVEPKKLTMDEVYEQTKGWQPERVQLYVQWLRDRGELNENL